MPSQLNPYLTFDGNAREAVEFYASVLGGTPSVMTFSDQGAPDPELADKVMHASLDTPAGALMASDTAPGTTFTPGDRITMSLSGDDVEQLRGWFAGLAEGGEVTMPLAVQMWGDEFGMLTDRFGVPWMVNIAQPQG